MLFFLNVLFFPFKINKKFIIREDAYESILGGLVAIILNCIGVISWAIGIIAVIIIVCFLNLSESKLVCVGGIFCCLFFIMIGSLMIISANEFSKVTDSNKIYAYSASVLALLSGIVTIVSLVLQIV